MRSQNAETLRGLRELWQACAQHEARQLDVPAVHQEWESHTGKPRSEDAGCEQGMERGQEKGA